MDGHTLQQTENEGGWAIVVQSSARPGATQGDSESAFKYPSPMDDAVKGLDEALERQSIAVESLNRTIDEFRVHVEAYLARCSGPRQIVCSPLTRPAGRDELTQLPSHSICRGTRDNFWSRSCQLCQSFPHGYIEKQIYFPHHRGSSGQNFAGSNFEKGGEMRHQYRVCGRRFGR